MVERKAQNEASGVPLQKWELLAAEQKAIYEHSILGLQGMVESGKPIDNEDIDSILTILNAWVYQPSSDWTATHLIGSLYDSGQLPSKVQTLGDVESSVSRSIREELGQ